MSKHYVVINQPWYNNSYSLCGKDLAPWQKAKFIEQVTCPVCKWMLKVEQSLDVLNKLVQRPKSIH